MANVLKRILFLLLLLWSVINSYAQAVQLQIKPVDDFNIDSIVNIKKSFKSKPECYEYINRLSSILQSKGFISASIDSIKEQDQKVVLNLFLGRRWQWGILQLPNDLKQIPDINFKDIKNLPESILIYFENHGYPFAKISFDSITFTNNNTINATLKLDKGFEYRLDSIRVLGNLKINNTFLQQYLNIKKNDLYNANNLQNISSRLKQLSYLKEFKNWDVLMLNSSYLLNLYLKTVNQNKFDAIIGFLPNNNQTDGKLLLTVDAKLNLYNAFANGEHITFNWQQIQPQSPRIDIGFQQPFIFKSKLGFSFNFNLYKRDSAFLNINANVGLDFSLTNQSYLKVFLNNFNTRIIDADTTQIIAKKKLPSILDMNIANLGVEYHYNHTIGSRISKRKGFEYSISTSFGQKKITENNSITSIKADGFNYKTLYDSINKNTYQIKAKLAANYYAALSKLSLLKLSLNYGILNSGNYLQNELYQIGGFKLLRGFDEENIFTNQYLVNSVEYRYLFDVNSYFFGFTDWGYAENKTTKTSNTYLGVGLGLALETKQGILNVSFAVGKRNDLPFSFKASKIHIGIITNF